VVIPCSLYLPHGALVEFFTLSWEVERWNISSVSLLLIMFLKSIGENIIAMILWFLNIRHSALFLVCHSSPRLNKCSFSSYPTKAKYVELVVKEKGTTQVMYIAKLKDGPKRVKIFFQWFRKGFQNGMMEGEKMESYKKEFLKLKCFSPLKILTFPFIWRDSWGFLSFFQYIFFLFFSFFLCSVSWGLGGFDDIRGEDLEVLMILEEKTHFFNNLFSNEMLWIV
jgi:hypothetical protein